MSNLPLSRQKDIVVQEMENEILLYDLIINKALLLNETTAKVYQGCDGKTSLDELKRQHKFTDEIVFLALDELKKSNLIAENSDYVSPLTGMNRREVIRRVGLASLIALPLISSVVAPNSAMAASNGLIARFGVCPSGSGCAAGLTCRLCDVCPNTPNSLNVLTCCTSATGQIGPGVITAGTCNTDQTGCNTAAAQYCCSGTANFTVGLNIFTGNPCPNANFGTCLCGS